MEPAGTEVPIVWNGRRARAFVPALLADRDLALDARAAARCGAAEKAVAHGAEALPADYAPLARLLLRAEGIASSFVEGVTAPVVEIVLAEHDTGATGAHTPAAWVAANLHAAQTAVEHAATSQPLTLDDVLAWHRALMTGSPTPSRYVGALRDEQGWIGGSSPLDAHLVTPPAEALPDLVADLLSFANRTDVDAIAQAAIVHAQFEVVHPFADGNGRVGRVLISWLLTRHLSLLTPPPVSVRLAADVGGYSAGLTQFRFGQTSTWVGWFADAVSGAGRAQRDLVDAVDDLGTSWRARLGSLARERALRSDSLVWRLIELLPQHLVLTSSLVAAELAVTRKAARDALGVLVEAGVLMSYGTAATQRGRPSTLYVSEELLGLAGSNPLRR